MFGYPTVKAYANKRNVLEEKQLRTAESSQQPLVQLFRQSQYALQTELFLLKREIRMTWY